MKTWILLPLVCVGLGGCVVGAAVDLAATTVMTAGKLAVKGTGAVINAAIPDKDKKKNKDKDKNQDRRPVSDDVPPPSYTPYTPASVNGGYDAPQGSDASEDRW